MLCQVVIQSEDTPGGPTTPVADAWVYWREGGTVTVLRTNASGRLMRMSPGGDATRPWDYAPLHTTNTGTQVQLFHSRGAKPVPTARLSDPPDVFVQRTVNLPPATAGTPTPTPVVPVSPNTLVATPTATVVIPSMNIRLTRPEELSVWPLLWEPVDEHYATDGLSQGAALWGASALNVTENSAAAAPSDAVRSKERGLRVSGSLPAGATGVKVQVLDAAGNVLNLRQSTSSTSDVTELAGTLGAAAGASRTFDATVYFARATDAFGPVQLIVRSEGLTPPLMASFACQLAGVQIALVADATNGQSRGTAPGEADEKLIIDFLDSPQATRPLLSAETRARRMVAYDFGIRQRALSATVATQVETPEMPMWMAELHLLGFTQANLEDLLLRRAHLPTPAGTLTLALEWSLGLSWDGPDSGTTSPRRYQYSYTHPSAATSQSVTLSLDAQHHVANINAQGEVPGALSPAPTAPTFPVTGRRVPLVVANGQSRRWGRQSGGQTKDALLVEWQPLITDAAGQEILRGGDGELKLTSLSINGARVDPGAVASTAAGPHPEAALPTFRVRGANPASPANALIDALVEEYVNAHNTAASVTALSLACWQETCRRILAHEAGHQFEWRGARRPGYAGQFFGLEQDMPVFGPPHGYGYGQHDNPPVTDDGAWSFIANLRESVRRIIHDKGGSAWGLVSGHLPAAMNQRTRAVYQRELVRRYNGGTEFHWNATSSDWEISPTVAQWADNANHAAGANPRLLYPNQVLGTAIVYSTGAGAATTFPWPIAFTAASYGPSTA